MNLPTNAVVNAVLRHAVTAIATIVLTVGTLGVISSGDASAIVAGIQQVGSGLGTVFQGIAAIAIVVSPMIAAWSSRQKAQIAAVNAIPGVKVVSERSIAAPVTDVPK